MRIDEYFKQHHDDDSDKDLERLVKGHKNSTIAAELWSTIADGSADVGETLIWVQHVANEINEHVVNGKDRDAAPAALKAIGFWGRIDHDHATRELMEILAAFDEIDDKGQPLPRTRWTATRWLERLRSHGHLQEISEKTARNKINNWRKDLGIE
jgi:hypothetical protein